MDRFSTQQLIEHLHFQPHSEGGYFAILPGASTQVQTGRDGSDGLRAAYTLIHYMLTKSFPRLHWHVNASDIASFWHAGSTLRYYLITDRAELKVVDLGPHVDKGQLLQYTIPGGWWKAGEILLNDSDAAHTVISECVVPGFSYHDRKLVSASDFKATHPEIWDSRADLRAFIREPEKFVFHMCPKSYFDAQDEARDYVPRDYGKDGFIHCCGSLKEMHHISNLFLRSHTPHDEPFVLLVLRNNKLDKLVFEPPVHPAGDSGTSDAQREVKKLDESGQLFPHIYSPCPRSAIAEQHLLRRSPDGSFDWKQFELPDTSVVHSET